MRGSHKDVLQMEKKWDTRDEGKVCVQFATRNSMQANNYAALSLEPGTWSHFGFTWNWKERPTENPEKLGILL